MKVRLPCVRREDEGAAGQSRRDLPQQREPPMRHGTPVQRQAVAVEPPGKCRIARERGRISDLLEMQASAAERRIGPPETLAATKIRQAGIHPHARPGGDDEAVGLVDPAGDAGNRGGRQAHRGGQRGERKKEPRRHARGAMNRPTRVAVSGVRIVPRPELIACAKGKHFLEDFRGSAYIRRVLPGQRTMPRGIRR